MGVEPASISFSLHLLLDAFSCLTEAIMVLLASSTPRKYLWNPCTGRGIPEKQLRSVCTGKARMARGLHSTQPWAEL